MHTDFRDNFTLGIDQAIIYVSHNLLTYKKSRRALWRRYTWLKFMSYMLMDPQDMSTVSLLPIMHVGRYLGATVHTIRFNLLKMFADMRGDLTT
jgi:hypothetical protein